VTSSEGLLLIDKPIGITSFRLVAQLRRLTGVRKIGHAGTLDPFATGVMVMLLGRQFTRLSNLFLDADKEYKATLKLGVVTDSFDCTGEIVQESCVIPTLEEVEEAIAHFQGEIEQIPPMFSAKKRDGKRLYELARKGETIAREPVRVRTEITLLSYSYPEIVIQVACSKGTYIRSLGHDIGQKLGSGAHLTALRRLRSGAFHIDRCLDGEILNQPAFDVTPHLLTSA
jgi:tRNA pseudouridine55 synthase